MARVRIDPATCDGFYDAAARNKISPFEVDVGPLLPIEEWRNPKYELVGWKGRVVKGDSHLLGKLALLTPSIKGFLGGRPGGVVCHVFSSDKIDPVNELFSGKCWAEEWVEDL
jgi:hypothetical protein